MDGIGCTTDLVNEIFSTLTFEEIGEMKKSYELKDESLPDRLRSELSGEHQAAILRLLTTPRDCSEVDINKIRALTAELFTVIDHGKTVLGALNSAAESKATSIISSLSWQQCQTIRV